MRDATLSCPKGSSVVVGGADASHPQTIRNAAIEECARVLDQLAKNQWDGHAQDALFHAAAAIRALKEGI